MPLTRTDSSLFFFIMPGNIPLFLCHSFFIRSSVDGHLGCFHVLATVNRATMNFGVHVSFSIIIFSEYMPNGGIAGSYDSFLSLVFKQIPMLFSIVAVSIYTPTSSARGFPFFHMPSSIYCLPIFFTFQIDAAKMKGNKAPSLSSKGSQTI